MGSHLIRFAASRLAGRNAVHSFNVVFHIVAWAAQYLPIIRFVRAAFARRLNMVELELERVALAANRAAVIVFCQYRLELVAACFAHVGQSKIPDFARVGHNLCLAVHGSYYARMAGRVNPHSQGLAKIIKNI